MAESANDMEKNDFEIEETKKKLYLVPMETGRKRLYAKENVFVTINPKYGSLNIGKKAMIAMGMTSGWYRLFYDVHRQVIAWQVAGGLDKNEMESKAWKTIKITPSTGQLNISVGRILDLFEGLDKNKSYKNLEVKKYQEKGSMLDSSSYYYVVVSDHQIETPRY